MKRTVTLWKYIETRITELDRNGRYGTSKNYATAEKALKTYCEDKDLPLQKVTPELIGSFNRHLYNKGVVRNSVSQYNRVLRAVYNRAVKENLVQDKHPFANVYTGIDGTAKRAISERMISRIAGMFTGTRLEFTRDLFIFSYVTYGMAFADMAYLKKQNINGNKLIYFRKKTGSRIVVKLEPMALHILLKYSSTSNGDYVFPIIGDKVGKDAYKRFSSALTEYNRNLKTITRKAGLTVPLSSYVSRHSWATAARNNGADISSVSEALGHTSEKTTRIYLGSFDCRKIELINKKLTGHLKTPDSKQNDCISGA